MTGECLSRLTLSRPRKTVKTTFDHRSVRMKRKLGIALLALGLVALTIPAAAHRYTRHTDGHPLRVVAYVLHPVGVALEYGIARPIHWLVSRNDLDIVFGHQPKLAEENDYFEWVHGDYEPSIRDDREKLRLAERQIGK